MTTTTGRMVPVGLGEIKTATDAADTLTCLGLGSCVAVCLHDAKAGVAGMAHVVLPASQGRDATTMPGKFADTAIPALVAQMEQQGAMRARMTARIAGGAQMAATREANSIFEIGKQNAEAVTQALTQARIPLRGSELGGHVGRTVRLSLPDGKVVVTFKGNETITL
jgi:chemotaxis protein CheD